MKGEREIESHIRNNIMYFRLVIIILVKLNVREKTYIEVKRKTEMFPRLS
jgi:hypothetical protein